MPDIEIQLNNTGPQIDDYVTTTTSIPGRIRILNFRRGNAGAPQFNFPGGIAIQLRNVPFLTGGQVRFSTGGAFANTLNLTLPQNGDWVTFLVRGNTTSTVDKDAVIEVLENRPAADGIVLARKALMVTATPPALPIPRVQVTVGARSTIDDYVSWSPTQCTIQLVNHEAFSDNVTVRIRNMPGTNRLRFANNGSITPTATATNTTIEVSLPENGSSVSFYTAGFFNPDVPNSAQRGSLRDKDAVLEVTDASGTVLAREGLMVRIRKNGNTMSVAERDGFLRSMRTLNQTFGRYDMFRLIHGPAPMGTTTPFSQAHQINAFLPWHRAFVSQLERNLQAIDPAVAIPYWKYDEAAGNVFAPNFMGSNTNNVTGPEFATLSATNPIFEWPNITAPGIQRFPAYNSATGTPTVTTNPNRTSDDIAMSTDMAILGIVGAYQGFRTTFEGSSHNGAHNNSGGWIGGSAAAAVRDPLFFMLHANVDRIWARWQQLDPTPRFDFTNSAGYTTVGKFPTTAPFGSVSIANYGEEPMWPWNNKTGPALATTSLDDRPTFVPVGSTPFPQTLGFILSPTNTPAVREMIDYRTNRVFLNTAPNQGMGFGYDDRSGY